MIRGADQRAHAGFITASSFKNPSPRLGQINQVALDLRADDTARRRNDARELRHIQDKRYLLRAREIRFP